MEDKNEPTETSAVTNGEPMAENGEPKISKRAAAKEAAKREKAAKKAEAQAKAAAEKASLPSRPKPVKKEEEPLPTDFDPMDNCFKVGWLKDVYQINPAADKVFTRFPPEPNGFLHIGHAKAIAVNFGFAKFYEGKCYLRYDDTNPSAEEEMFFNTIRESVEWLGYEPFKITHSSDHFDELYALAEELIKRDKAYMCHCTQEEMKLQKGGEGNKDPRFECAHRNRPVEESLAEFREMRDGKFPPKAVVLRMKQDILGSGNPYMWDMPAYRITEKSEHHRTGNKWKIYPTYDFTHCICDALETITHSLCTVEFRTARESYDWLINEVQDKLPAIPQQREYGRLNVTGTVLSKRKILKLVDEKVVRDWDDPRLYTLMGLRRRGIPPGAIRSFVAELGVSDNVTIIQLVRLETATRKYLERTVPRLMLVPDPIKVIIDDLPADHLEDIPLDFMRGDARMGSHVVPFTRELYIDRSDFREESDPNFFRLAPGKTVGLLNVPYPIQATTFRKDAAGRVTEIHASYCRPAAGEKPAKPQAYIQWVAHCPARASPVRAEVRIFERLFRSDNPDAAEGGFLQDVNPDSEHVFRDAVMETGFNEIVQSAPWPKDHIKRMHPGPWDVRFQGMRVAYFALDTDSDVAKGKIVLNKIVGLKEDSAKA